VFVEEEYRPAIEQPGRKGIKKGRVLVSVNESDSFTSQQPGEVPGAAPVDPFAPAKNLDWKAFLAKLLTEGADLIQAHEYEAILIAQTARKTRGQHFRAAHTKTVQQLADRHPWSCDCRISRPRSYSDLLHASTLEHEDEDGG
jgi:hypothetical protein